MNDPEERRLADLMHALDPSPGAEARMQAAVFRALDAPVQSLAAEWIELLRVRPAANGALVLAAGLVLYFTTPLGALAALLAR